MSTQRDHGRALLALGLTVGVGLFGCGKGGGEARLRFADCPAAVQKGLADNGRGVVFQEVERETHKGGEVTFEAKGRGADGRKIEVKVGDDGSLVGFKSEKDDD